MMLPGVDFGIVTENSSSMIILLIIDFAISERSIFSVGVKILRKRVRS